MDFSIDIKEKSGLRSLHFDNRWMQGAMRVGQPWDLALEYTQVMMACLLLRDEVGFPRHVLLIGLGAGSLAKFFYHYFPSTHLTVVEIAPRVVEVARESFELPDDPSRLNIVIGDGVEYVMNTSQLYDVIMVDGFNEHAHPGELNTLHFYQACRTRLSEQGVLVVNLIGLSHGVKGGFVHVEATFDGRALMLPKCKSGNTIALAVCGDAVDLSLVELRIRAQQLEARTNLALMPTLIKLEHEAGYQQGRLSI
jgi:spermidine synthase